MTVGRVLAAGSCAALVLGGVFLGPPAASAPELVAAPEPCRLTPRPPPDRGAFLTTPPKLTVQPGATVADTAVLDLDARPSPVDLFFVLDSSKSMAPTFDSLKLSMAQAAQDLEASGIDVYAGAADFSGADNPYHLIVKSRPVDCEMIAALAGALALGGGAEPHRFALEQAVTGNGNEAYRVEPGKGATWRPGALRIVVHATDAGIVDGLPGAPPHQALIEMFRGHDARHVGIHSFGSGEDASPAEVRDGLDRLGTDTGTVAPGSGIDCNGDGRVELAAGEPVTCEFGNPVGQGGIGPPASIGGIVTQVVRSLRTTTGVQLAVTADPEMTVGLTQRVQRVDLADKARAQYGFTVACGQALEGRELPVRFEASIAGEAVASATMTVACLAPPAAAPVIETPPAVAAAQTQAPASSSVAPSSAVQGAGQASAPAGSTAQAPAQSPSFGAAVAPENELQVARAGAGAGAGAATRAAGGMMALGAAAAYRRRSAAASNRRR